MGTDPFRQRQAVWQSVTDGFVYGLTGCLVQDENVGEIRPLSLWDLLSERASVAEVVASWSSMPFRESFSLSAAETCRELRITPKGGDAFSAKEYMQRLIGEMRDS
jgi:hypothetical protein